MFYRRTETKIIEDKHLLDGLTNGAVARAMGVSIPYISMVRNGRRIPSEDFYAKLVDVVAELKSTP